MQAISIVLDEHRALGGVLHGMLHVMREIHYFDVKPNFELLGAMTYYIRAFPERLHHPKEEEYLFKVLHRRRPDVAPLLERLHAQHQTGAALLRSIEDALARYREKGADAFPAFAGAVATYAAFHWDHAATEENTLLPLARAHLTTDDWAAIDAAFRANDDPLVGTPVGLEFKELFCRIVSLAPPPLGMGPVFESSAER